MGGDTKQAPKEVLAKAVRGGGLKKESLRKKLETGKAKKNKGQSSGQTTGQHGTNPGAWLGPKKALQR